jgi:hypothetical protein
LKHLFGHGIIKTMKTYTLGRRDFLHYSALGAAMAATSTLAQGENKASLPQSAVPAETTVATQTDALVVGLLGLPRLRGEERQPSSMLFKLDKRPRWLAKTTRAE